jgi:hypothetical protein
LLVCPPYKKPFFRPLVPFSNIRKFRIAWDFCRN